jgi:hypothetical protein
MIMARCSQRASVSLPFMAKSKAKSCLLARSLSGSLSGGLAQAQQGRRLLTCQSSDNRQQYGTSIGLSIESAGSSSSSSSLSSASLSTPKRYMSGSMSRNGEQLQHQQQEVPTSNHYISARHGNGNGDAENHKNHRQNNNDNSSNSNNSSNNNNNSGNSNVDEQLSLSRVTGMPDLLPSSIGRYQYIEHIGRQLCSLYNINEIRTPIVERQSVFQRGLGDTSDVVTKVYTHTYIYIHSYHY